MPGCTSECRQAKGTLKARDNVCGPTLHTPIKTWSEVLLQSLLSDISSLPLNELNDLCSSLLLSRTGSLEAGPAGWNRTQPWGGYPGAATYQESPQTPKLSSSSPGHMQVTGGAHLRSMRVLGLETCSSLFHVCSQTSYLTVLSSLSAEWVQPQGRARSTGALSVTVSTDKCSLSLSLWWQ